MKHGVVGVYHQWLLQRLHRYCIEFDFRFNRRKIKDGSRTIEAIKIVEWKRLMYRDSSQDKLTEEVLAIESDVK
jgi:hypothetical protein